MISDPVFGGSAREISEDELYQLRQEEERKNLMRQEQLLSGQAVPLPEEQQFVQSNTVQVTPDTGKSFLDKFEESLLDMSRALGLSVRTGMNAMSSSPVGIVTDLFSGGANQFLQDKAKIPYTREGFNQIGDIIGLPQPTEAEKPIMTVGEMATGAGLWKKSAQDLATAMTPNPMQNVSVGREVTRNIAKEVGDFGTVPTIASGAGGGAGLAVAEQEGATPVEALLASLFGSQLAMIPQSAIQMLKAQLSGARTPQQLAEVQKNIAYWKQVIGEKARIPVSAVTDSKMARGAEQLASQTVGGRNIMAQNAEDIQVAVGESVEGLANTLGRSNPTMAGKAIASGASDFRTAFYKKASEQYDRADRFIRPDHIVDPVNTMAYINKITSPIVGLEKTSESTLIASPELKKFASALNEDFINMQTNGRQGFSYEGLKVLRSRVGEAIGNSVFNPDVDVKQLKALYATLSQDIEQSFAGNQKALRELMRGDAFFKAGMKRMDEISSVIDAKGGGEVIYGKLVNGNREGATRMSAVMRSLPVEDQKLVTSAFLRRMGRQREGFITGESLPENFSTETFLTNYEKLSPEAKRALFGNADYGKSFDSDIKAILKVARDVRKGGKYLSNPSGTGGVVSGVVIGSQAGSALGGLMYSVYSGGALAPAMLGVGGAVVPPVLSNLTAKAMTNPKFVRWLASGSKLPMTPKATSAWLNQLGAIAGKDEELQEVHRALVENRMKMFDVQTQPMPFEEGKSVEYIEPYEE